MRESDAVSTSLPIVCPLAGDGEGLAENTEGVEADVLVLLGSNVWEGVAVGFLLAKVRVSCLTEGAESRFDIPSALPSHAGAAACVEGAQKRRVHVLLEVLLFDQAVTTSPYLALPPFVRYCQQYESRLYPWVLPS